MACKWKGKVFEEHTVPLLALLLQENGSLDPKVRGDAGYAIGISQHHICHRKTFGKKYCTAKAKAVFEATHPEFGSDVWSQFYQYSDAVRPLLEDGKGHDEVIWSWNPGEKNRRAKINRWEMFVMLSTQ